MKSAKQNYYFSCNFSKHFVDVLALVLLMIVLSTGCAIKLTIGFAKIFKADSLLTFDDSNHSYN